MIYGKCEKCKDSDAKHRFQHGYVAVEGGSRWLRYFMLCGECNANARIATANKQHPLYYARTDENDNLYLEKSDITIWPEEEKRLEGR